MKQTLSKLPRSPLKRAFSTASKLKIVGFGGTLRKASCSMGLLRYAKDLSEEFPEIEFEIADYYEVPLYNSEIEVPMPGSVKKLREQLTAADGVLMATSEYNYSIPGVFKNALDWVSRPEPGKKFEETPLYDKPVALMSVGGRSGGLNAQHHVRTAASFMNFLVLNKPNLAVGLFDKPLFDKHGVLTDAETKARVKEVLQALIVWTKKLSK